MRRKEKKGFMDWHSFKCFGKDDGYGQKAIYV